MSGEKTYIVEQGDCISSIAENEGFFWETLWNANSDLKSKREDPNLLVPGDEIIVPEKQAGMVAGPTEKRHRFLRKGVPAKLRLVMERDDLPIKDTDFILVIDGVSHEGKTDSTGLLEIAIPPNARKGHLTILDLEIELELGGLDPIEEDTGVQGRLQNLGFYHGEIDGKIGPLSEVAIEEFRAFKGLPEGKQIGQELRDALVARQDEEHETEAEEVDDADEDESCTDVDAVDEDETDEEDDDDSEIDVTAANDDADDEPGDDGEIDIPDDEDDK